VLHITKCSRKHIEKHKTSKTPLLQSVFNHNLLMLEFTFKYQCNIQCGSRKHI